VTDSFLPLVHSSFFFSLSHPRFSPTHKFLSGIFPSSVGPDEFEDQFSALLLGTCPCPIPSLLPFLSGSLRLLFPYTFLEFFKDRTLPPTLCDLLLQWFSTLTSSSLVFPPPPSSLFLLPSIFPWIFPRSRTRRSPFLSPIFESIFTLPSISSRLPSFSA